jgi:hypothetical protein
MGEGPPPPRRRDTRFADVAMADDARADAAHAMTPRRASALTANRDALVMTPLGDERCEALGLDGTTVNGTLRTLADDFDAGSSPTAPLQVPSFGAPGGAALRRDDTIFGHLAMGEGPPPPRRRDTRFAGVAMVDDAGADAALVMAPLDDAALGLSDAAAPPLYRDDTVFADAADVLDISSGAGSMHSVRSMEM